MEKGKTIYQIKQALSEIQLKPLVLVISGVLLFFIAVGIFFLSQEKLAIGLVSLLVPFVLFFIGLLFHKPIIGFWAAFTMNYFAIGLTRYVPAPLGLSIDGLLLLTWLAIIFSQFNRSVPWKNAGNITTLLAIIWFGYSLFQLVNPEAVSRIAWFYAMRGVSLYMLLTIPLAFILLNHPSYLNRFLKVWAYFTIAGILKGLMQKFIGTDPWENHWLAVIGGKTHLLPGGLRVFSFFSDAATYGGSMGFSGVVFTIIALHTQNKKQKYFYALVGIMAFFAMMISGTRGAIAVPFAGFAVYAVLSKKVKIVVAGVIVLVAMYSFLKFSTIGNSVYEIRRFRTGLDPDNPSLMVRKENQQLLKSYLATRPFGGGIGSAGNWGLRFSPGTFLAETPTDSWFVQIWAEQGKVGLILHLGILLTIVGSSSYIIMFRLKREEYISKGSALTAGMVGVVAASYGSGALGQMPNGIIIYASMAFIQMMIRWEREKLVGGSK